MSQTILATIQIRRGLRANLPAIGLPGEPFFCTDTGELFVWNGTAMVQLVGTGGGGGGGGAVASVNSKTGVVVLNTSDIAEGANQYFTNGRAAAAAPVQSVAGKTGAVVLGEADVTNLSADLAAAFAGISNVISGLASKQESLGFTPENVGNKDVDGTLAANSDTKYPSQKATKTYADTKQTALGFTPENPANKDADGTLAANSDTKYASQKATKTYADTKQAALGFTPENVANKDTSGTLAANSDTKYASQKAVKTYVDTGLALKAPVGVGLSLPAEASRLGEYRFDEAGGFSLTDYSGNGNHGTLGVSSAPITNIALTSNVVTVLCSNSFVVGQKVTMSGLTTSTYLNGQVLTIASRSATQFTASFVHANDTTHSDTGTAYGGAPTWIPGGLDFVGNKYGDTPSGNSANGGQAVVLPAGLNGAKTIMIFMGHQYVAAQPTSFDNHGLLCVGTGAAGHYNGLAINDYLASLPAGGGASFGNSGISTSYGGFAGGSSPNVTTISGNAQGIFSLALQMNLGGSDAVFVNGQPVRVVVSGSGAGLQDQGSYQLGGQATRISSYPSWYTGQVYYLCFWSVTLTPAQIAQAHQYMVQAMFNRGITPFLGQSGLANVIMSDGDSIQAYLNGWFVNHNIDSTPLGPWNQLYESISGDGIADLLRRSQWVDQWLPQSSGVSTTTPGGSSIYEVMIGTNNLSNTVSNAQAFLQQLSAACKARRAAGWNRVIVSTLPDNGADAHQLFNQYIRRTWPLYADGLADVAADPGIGATGANHGATNNYYFAAGLHPDVPGQIKIALIKSRIINHLIGNGLNSGAPSIAGHRATVSNTVLTANVATYTTTLNHGLQAKQWVTISGLSSNGATYNGTFQIASVPSLTTFTVAITHANIGSTGDTGTADLGPNFTMQDTDTYIECDHTNENLAIFLPTALGYTGQSIWIKNLKSGDANTVTLNPCATQNTVRYLVTATAVTSNVVTITSKHNFKVGDVIVITGLVTSTFLNGQSLTITAVTGAVQAQTAFTAVFSHADYGTAAESTGFATRTQPAETIDAASSLLVPNGVMCQLRSVLIDPQTGGNNWAVVNNA